MDTPDQRSQSSNAPALRKLAVPLGVLLGVFHASHCVLAEGSNPTVTLASDTENLRDAPPDRALVQLTSKTAPPQEFTNEFASLVQAKQALHDVVLPLGPEANCQTISQWIRAQRHDLPCAFQLKPTLFHREQQACLEQHAKRITTLLSAKLQQEKVRNGLKAHVAVYATWQLAIEQQQTFGSLDTFRQRQQVAMENGLPVRDPSALTRLELQLADTVFQTVGGHRTAREQLVILTQSSEACRYRPQLETDCGLPLLDLCVLIEQAQRQRIEIQILGLVESMLQQCGQAPEFCQSVMQLLSGVTLIHSSAHTHPATPASNAWRALLRPSDSDQATSLLRSVRAVKIELQKKIASEVAAAWHQAATAQQRHLAAQDTLLAAQQRLAQLERLNDEITASIESTLEATLQTHQARSNLILREQDWQTSLIELAYATGEL